MSALEHEAVRGVVDVLGGAENVDDLAQAGQRRPLSQARGGSLQVLADQVLHGLDIVAGDSLEL